MNLFPSPYNQHLNVPLKPVPPPRRKKPIPLPRAQKARVPDPRVQKLIKEIAPFYSPEAIQEFRDKINKRVSPAEGIETIERKKGLKGIVQSFEVLNIFTKDPRKLFSFSKNAISKKLAELFKQKGPFKAYLTLQVEFKKRVIKDGEEAYEYVKPYFNSTATAILNEFEIKEVYDSAVEVILNRIAKWLSKGSGWVIENIHQFYINIVSYVPLKGKSYFPSPEKLRNSRKGLINLKNDDNRCFLWCHVRHQNPLERNPQRITLKDKEIAKTLDYSGVTFPVSIKNMDKIEKQKKININVYGYDEDKEYIFPIRNSKEKYEDTLNVLLLEKDAATKGYQQHYVLITDFNRINFNITKHESKKYYCPRCLQHFYSEYLLEQHKEDCKNINGKQKIEIPKEGSKVYFQNTRKNY